MKTLVLKASLILCCFVCIFSLGKSQDIKPYRTGQKIENISLFDIESKKYSLKNVSNKKAVVLLFISNKCTSVNKVIDQIKNIQNKYAEDVEFWAINSFNPNTNPEEGEEYMKEFVKNNNLSIPYIVDLSQNTSKSFSVKYTPTVVILKKEADGFRFVHIGSVATLDKNIKNLIDGKALIQSSPGSSSCMIK